MMDGVMNLCRVKFRDHQRLTRGDLTEYSVPTYQGMGDVPRAGNDSGGGQLGNAIHCKPHGANDWLYIVVQEAVWDASSRSASAPTSACPISRTIRGFAKIGDRRKNQQLMWTLINKFAEKYTKRELMEILNPLDVPCGPIMSTEDLATDEHVRGPRHVGRARSPAARQVVQRRHADQAVGLAGGHQALADARRAHGRDPAGGARLRRSQDRGLEDGGGVLRAAEEGRLSANCVIRDW